MLAAQDLFAYLAVVALDDDLAVAEPKTIRYRLLHVAARITTNGRTPTCTSTATGPGYKRCSPRSRAYEHCQHPPDPASRPLTTDKSTAATPRVASLVGRRTLGAAGWLPRPRTKVVLMAMLLAFGICVGVVAFALVAISRRRFRLIDAAKAVAGGVMLLVVISVGIVLLSLLGVEIPNWVPVPRNRA